MITTRVKLILLILLNTAIILLPANSSTVFIAFIIVSSIAFYKSLMVNLKAIFLYLLGLFIVTILINYFLSDSNLLDVLPQFLKLFAVITISILLITDINIMELVASISFLKIPTKIAIAFGVGFRYFPLLINDIKRIQFIQTSKGYGLNPKSFKTKGFIESISVFLMPLFLSMLNRADNIALSVTLQQLEKRAQNYNFKKITNYEFLLLFSALLLLIYCILINTSIDIYAESTIPAQL